MKIIDAHIHFSNIDSFKEVSNKSKDEFDSMIAIGMGVTETSSKFPSDNTNNPMNLDLDTNPSNMYCCLGINPLSEIDVVELEKAIKGNVVGFKIYAGYYHVHIYDPIYDPVYKLASKYQLPVVIHTGDTFSEDGLLKYAHPLEVDELAVKYKDINFIIAHFGDPFIMTAAEVAAKNKNVFIDLSGWIIGSKEEVDYFNNPLFTRRLKEGLFYLDDYKKVLYGSDWPLVNTHEYIKFIKELIPEMYHEDVFFHNANRVFKLGL